MDRSLINSNETQLLILGRMFKFEFFILIFDFPSQNELLDFILLDFLESKIANLNRNA